MNKHEQYCKKRIEELTAINKQLLEELLQLAHLDNPFTYLDKASESLSIMTQNNIVIKELSHILAVE